MKARSDFESVASRSTRLHQRKCEELGSFCGGQQLAAGHRSKAFVPAGKKRYKLKFSARPKALCAGLYARVSTHDQQTLPMQLRTMRAYAMQRGSSIGMEVQPLISR
jgi:hypothetical protein